MMVRRKILHMAVEIQAATVVAIADRKQKNAMGIDFRRLCTANGQMIMAMNELNVEAKKHPNITLEAARMTVR